MNSGVLKTENSMEPASFRSTVRNFQEDFNPFMSENQSGTVFIRVSIPELKVQKCLQFELDESVWQAKQRILSSFSKNLRDSLNYGLYMPPMNGRAGKFLDEERLLREYPLQGPIGFLEFKHKRRVYKLIHLNPRKLRQLHTKSNLKHFMENVRNGNTSKINKMTNKGIDPNFQESGTGETPLTLVTALDPQKSREIIISLVSGGAHLDFRTKQGLTAIHKAVLADNLTALKTLLDLGASTNYKDAHGLTPLYYSVMYQKSAVITETLLFERAFLGIHDEQGWQEVHQACRHGLVQHLEHLIFYGVDMNAVTKTGNTPLHICAENNMENCARVLLFRGANKEILNFINQSAQQTAIIAGNMELAELIRNHKSEDVVPFKEMPSFSDRREKSYMLSSNFSVLSRSRSDPKLNLAGLDMDMKDQQAQTVPTRAFKSPSQRFHTNFHYGSYPASQSSDSPKSLSISSSSSGPGFHGLRRSYCNPSRHVEMLFIPTDPSPSSSSDYSHMSHDFCLYKSSVGSESSFSSLRSAHPSHTQLDVSSLSSAKSYVSADVRYLGLSRDQVYVCVKSFTPQYPNDLEMKAGEFVEVLSSGDGDFWEGSVNGRYGYFPADHLQEVRLRRKGSMEDLLGESRETLMMNRNTLAALVTSDSEHSPRTVVLQRGSEGFGFVLRGAKSQLKPSGELDFRPTNEFPALQYLDNVDAGSPSDKAGLKPGDFILEINGENVVRASHDRVVNLIRASGNTLAMKVVTVRSTGRSQDWFVNQDRSKTMPNRKKKAPEPPRRDPHTSLSYSRAEGQNVAEEMKAMEKLDKAISGERRDSTTSAEQKIASIRGRHAVKRVSCIDTENLEVDQQKSNHISPSEARINKYHKGQNGALERSKSNPDLCGKPVYATPQVPDSANSLNRSNGTHVYDLSHGGQQGQPSPTNSRPKVVPPQPPSPGSNKSQRKQAPSPPTGEADMPNKSEVVSITTNRKSQYVSVPHPGKPIEGSQFESSFRPGTSAKLTEEPATTVPSLEQSKLKPGHTRSSSTGSGLIKMVTVPLSNVPKEDSGKKRTLAEDKVRDSAADSMKSYPSAQLLVTADVHTSIKDKKNSKLHEPEPDYDIDSGDEKKNFEPKAQVSAENNHKVTLISVGVESKKKPAPGSKRYTIHSTIPAEKPEESIEMQDVFIPPRPAGPAPIPPKNEERTWAGSRRSSFQSESSQPNSGNSSPRDMEVRMQKNVLAPPPPPPPAPPPPPVPRSPKSEIRFSQIREMNADKPALPTEDILAAVAKRKQRLEVDGPRITMNKPEVKPSPRDRTQVAILEAVAKRRTALQHQSETAVVDSIENQLQKTKKLQAAKFSFTMNQRSNLSSETNVKVNTNDNSKSYEATDKVQSKPHFLPVNSKPTKTEEKSKQPVKADIKSSHPTTKPVELSIKIGARSSGDSLPSMTELKPKILQKSDSTKTKVETVGKTTLQKPDIKKEATKTNIEVQNIGKHEEKTEDNGVKMRPKKSDETGQNGNDKSNRNSDFVQLAEIKRQEWLQRRASQSNKSNSTSKQTSPDTSKPGSPDRSWKKGLIQIKPVSDKPIGSAVIMKDATTDQSNTDTMLKGQTVNGDVNHNDRNRQSKNVNSVKSPPSAFRDRKEVNAVVQLEIIPPPSSFLSESSTDIDINSHHNNGPSFSPDSASIVSSLSTLSSLSGDHNDTDQHRYEDMIAPPPPGFDDGTNSADSFDEVAKVIPPPPEFGNGYSSDKNARPFTSKPVESWLCNDVLDWLESLNMGQYKSSFQQNSVDGKNLLSFTRSNFIELGVTQVGHRMNLERSIKKLAMHQSHSNIIESERL